MIRRLRRRWCRAFHRAIYFAGGPTYQCRRCGEVWENPAIRGPLSGPCHGKEHHVAA